MRVLVTGAAGFIGFHVARELLRRGHAVVGIDNFNAYYDPSLKEARSAVLEEAAVQSAAPLKLHRNAIEDPSAVDRVFAEGPFDRVFHFAAQAGVRYSMENPSTYVQSNLVGFANLLEACRHASVPHFVYASSSSVYGGSTQLPYREDLNLGHPLQLYASTKRANELMAHSYSHLYGLPTTGLRFFTVYGPWGRPDMAVSLFAQAILAGRPILLSNNGRHSRDFTYVDDAVALALTIGEAVPAANPAWDPGHPDPATSAAPFQILNVGSGRPAPLADLVAAIEDALGMRAVIQPVPRSEADMVDTWADISRIRERFGFEPTMPLSEGIRRAMEWYRKYHGVEAGGTSSVPEGASPARAARTQTG